MELEISFPRGARIIQLNDAVYCVIDPELGMWSVIPKEYVVFVQRLIDNSITRANKNVFEETELEIISTLYHNGNIVVNGKSRLRENFYEARLQQIIVVKITHECNLKCKYCYVNKNGHFCETFDVDIFISFMSKLYSFLGETRVFSVVIHGGEPFTKYNILSEVVVKLKRISNDIRISIQTNGTILSDDMLEFICNNDLSVGVSLDGVTETMNNNRLFGSGLPSVNNVLSNISKLVEAKINFGVLTVITNKNILGVLQMFDSLTEAGVNNFVFNALLGGDCSNKLQYKEFKALKNIYIELACKINDLNQNKDYEQFVAERSLSQLVLNISGYESTICSCSPCAAGTQTLGIDADGLIYPCDTLVGNKAFIIGHYSDSPVHCLNNDKIKLFSSRGVNTIKDCCNCPYRALCTYKCAADAYVSYGNLNHSHSMCEFAKMIIPELMLLIHQKRIELSNFQIC